ncbi:MAG: hypothetical protein EON95_16350, partial [Caulobacteraceae bacterium]
MTPADTPTDKPDETGDQTPQPTPETAAAPDAAAQAPEPPAGGADRAPGSWARARGVSLTMGPLPRSAPPPKPKPQMQASPVPTMAPPTLRRAPEPAAPPPAPPRQSSILTGSANLANPRPWGNSKPTGVVPTAGPISLDRDLDPTALQALGLGGQAPAPPRPAFKAMPAASPLSATRDE